MIDTHCHINMMVKTTFDVPLTEEQIRAAHDIIDEAQTYDVTHIINVGTSKIENHNCIALARTYKSVFATIGLHPNDAKEDWRDVLEDMKTLLNNKALNNIVGIGECGLDTHYSHINLPRQKDVFKAQIELALEHNLPLVIHSREAADETLTILEEYKNQFPQDHKAGVMHCFSYDQGIADAVIMWGFFLGIDGPITYPKNDQLRSVVKSVGLDNIVLETDAPYLPPQIIRGQKNHPRYIRTIAEYIAELLAVPFDEVAGKTTENSYALFRL